MKFPIEIEIDTDDLEKHIADRRKGQSKKDAYVEITECILNGLSCIDAMINRVSGGHIPLTITICKDLSVEDSEYVKKLLKNK